MQSETPKIIWFRAPVTPPLGTVLVAHGYAEHHRRFMPLIEGLQNAGFDVAAYDHEGHGTSSGRRANVDVGHLIAAHIDIRHDVLAQARTPDLFLFGHSMGGLITAASALLDAHLVRGIVLTGPAFIPQPEVSPRLARFALPFARLMPWLPAHTVKPGLLAHNPAVQEEFDADPLTYKGAVPLRTGVTMTIQGRHALEHSFLLRVPILILHGSDDALTSPAGSERFVASVKKTSGLADAEFRLIQGAQHEILNELDGSERIAEITEWFLARAASVSDTAAHFPSSEGTPTEDAAPVADPAPTPLDTPADEEDAAPAEDSAPAPLDTPTDEEGEDPSLPCPCSSGDDAPAASPGSTAPSI